jgi:hypothetical protein
MNKVIAEIRRQEGEGHREAHIKHYPIAAVIRTADERS